jgi:hypothetical protein
MNPRPTIRRKLAYTGIMTPWNPRIASLISITATGNKNAISLRFRYVPPNMQ